MRRLKGLGGVFKYRNSPYWWIRFTYRGREVRESSRSEHKNVAVHLLKERLKDIQSHAYVGLAAKDVTVTELLDDLRVTYTAQGRASLHTLRGHTAAVVAQLGSEKADNVTLPMLTRAVQAWQEEKYAPATIQKMLATLHRAYVLGQAARKVAIIPAFPHIPVQNARQGFCDWGTFLALLGHLPDDGLRDYAEWAARTGMRKGEIGKLTWAGYDRETGVVRLPGKDAKTGQPRRIVLAGPLLDLIARRVQARKEHPECPYIFHRGGGPIREFRGAWRTACQAAGIALRFHDLRRTAIRNMVRAGVSQAVAMAISGHRTDSVFRRYDITSDEDLRRAMEQTAEYVTALPSAGKVVKITDAV